MGSQWQSDLEKRTGMDNPLREYVRRIDTDEEDQIKRCVDCDEEFAFTKGEQRFFKEKDYSPPKRCKNCRDARKREREHRQ